MGRAILLGRLALALAPELLVFVGLYALLGRGLPPVVVVVATFALAVVARLMTWGITRSIGRQVEAEEQEAREQARAAAGVELVEGYLWPGEQGGGRVYPTLRALVLAPRPAGWRAGELPVRLDGQVMGLSAEERAYFEQGHAAHAAQAAQLAAHLERKAAISVQERRA